MKIEVHQSGMNPSCGMLIVYTRDIDEGEFVEILTENQLKKFENGEYKFNVKESDLMMRSKRYFPLNK